MSPVNTIDEIRAVVSAWASDRPLVERVVLFGSCARRDHQPNSDIDLAITVIAQESRYHNLMSQVLRIGQFCIDVGYIRFCWTGTFKDI
jgi:predicted nucleotidyltransferase